MSLGQNKFIIFSWPKWPIGKCNWRNLIFWFCGACLSSMLCLSFAGANEASKHRASEETNLSPASYIVPLERAYQAGLTNENKSNERRYRDLLARVQQALALRGIKTKISINFPRKVQDNLRGVAALEILPGTGNPYNELAQELARYGFSLRYFNKHQLASPYDRWPVLLTNGAVKRWYFSGRAFDNANFFSSYVYQKNMDIVRGVNLPPLASVLQDFVLLFKRPDCVTQDAPIADLPYAGFAIDERHKIFAPANSTQTTCLNPLRSYRLIDFHRAAQKMAAIAQVLQELQAQGKTIHREAGERLRRNFLNIWNNLAWRTANLNAALYIMLQKPASTSFYRNIEFKHLKIFAYPDQIQPYALVLDFPWTQERPERGHLEKVLQTAELQMFARYYLDLYRHWHELIEPIDHIGQLGPENLAHPLQKVLALEGRAAAVAQATTQHLWTMAELQDQIQAVQADLIQDLKQYDGFWRTVQTTSCAKNFVSPSQEEL